MQASFPIVLVILAILVAAGLAGFQYYFKKRQPRWGWFFALRFITYFTLLLLLINPKWKQTGYHIEKPQLAIAVDNSRSIAALDGDSTLRKTLTLLQENKALNDKFEVSFYSFGEQFRPLDSLSFSEAQTDIGAVFSNVSQLFAERPTPLILMTDGNQTRGREYTFLKRSYNAPIYAIPIGDTAHYADLGVSRVNVNRYAFLHNKFPVEIFVNYQGEQPVNTELTIAKENQVVFKKRLKFSSQHTAEILQTAIKADAVGLQNYTVTLTPLTHEKNRRNNRWKFAVEVIDQQTKVLLLSAFPHPDLGALKKAITHNPERRADIRYLGRDSLSLADYQLVVLYQPNAEFTPIYKRLKQLEAHTLTITGTATDYTFLNGAQDVFHKQATSQFEDYFAEQNAGYRNFQIPALHFADFPPLRDQFGNVTLTDNSAQVLLYQRIRGYATEQPLLFTVENSSGRHGFWLGENTWQWRAQVYRESGDFKTYDAFIDKLVQYLASTQQRDRLTVAHHASYNTGERIVLNATYFDKNYTFDARAELTAQLKNTTTGKGYRFPFVRGAQQYSLDLSHLPPGDYRFRVQVKGENIQQSGEFQIVDFDVEQQFTRANPEKLSRIAQLYYPNEIQKIIENLIKSPAFKPVQHREITTLPLIDWWYLLIILAMSLTAEWLMRKYRGLL